MNFIIQSHSKVILVALSGNTASFNYTPRIDHILKGFILQIDTLSISNFKAIHNLEMSFEEVTALIGSNNAGKSTILQALDYFFQGTVRLTQDDFHKRSDEENIEIIVRFKNLTDAEADEFGSAVIDDKITIKRTLTLTGDGHLQYSALSNLYDGFSAIRDENNGTRKRSMFNQLVGTLEGLERAANAVELEDNMRRWEQENPDKLTLSYLRGFFGAANVANGKLKKKTSLRLIPAVADAKTETSKTQSPIIQLLSDISKQIYENREEVQQFITKTNTEFEELVSPDNFPQLAGISESLTSTVQQYYSDSKLLAEWQYQDGVKVSFPQPTIRVEDQGFVSGLENVGHGLQRAALFSIIQFLSEQSAQADGDDFTTPQSDIILLVEEPEIYQHPHKQELICDAFHEISKGFSRATGIRFQIVFTTHSEKFINMRKFEAARILRRASDIENDIVTHSASGVSIDECRHFFAGLVGKEPMANEAFKAKMHIFSREVCEGFFAQKIILVEGVTDKAILEGFYAAQGRNPISDGISIIQMDGKSKMDKPFYIFKKLGIPVFVVFDSDASKNKSKQKTSINIILQTLAESPNPEEFPDGCFSQFSAFKYNLESYVKDAAGNQYDAFFKEVSENYELSYKEVFKTPAAISIVLSKCRNEGISIDRFDEIIAAVDAL